MRFRRIIRMFERGNVCVFGLRGTGKDVLFGNVIARRKKPYVSNLNYTNDDNYQVLDFGKLDIGKNSYRDLISGDIKYYSFPYEMGSDIYISDSGVYLPSQYCNELNRDYKYLPTYFALSRQCSRNSIHTNTQALSRTWDKIREQSEQYIMCRGCIVLFGKIVIQAITIYDKYQSAVDRVRPCRINVPILASKEVVQNAEIYRDKFYNQYGDVKNHLLIYWHKSQHDTYYFEKLFKEGRGKKTDEENTAT